VEWRMAVIRLVGAAHDADELANLNNLLLMASLAVQVTAPSPIALQCRPIMSADGQPKADSRPNAIRMMRVMGISTRRCAALNAL